jgi:demethylmenaquinone methyltransferase/2-methoxy-6-polyprenyl-1,4-benzoquinol methylase
MQPLSPDRPLTRYFDSDDSRCKFVRSLFDTCAPDYDRVCRIAAFGMGQRYRREALERAGLRPGMRVLDVASGTGLTAAEALTITGSSGRVVGVDPSRGMLQEARRVGHRTVQGVGEALPFADASFDILCMGYALRHLADLIVAFRDFRRVLRPGGGVVLLEITEPRSHVAGWLAKQYFQRVVPLLTARGARPGSSERLMTYYWDTIHSCVKPEVILGAMQQAGLDDVRREVVHGVFSEYRARRS